MKKSSNFTTFGPAFRAFMWRHSLTIFLVSTIGAIALATLILYRVVLSANNPAGTNTGTTITFDKATMDKIKKLQPASAQDSYSLPTNQRSNPFSE